MPPLSEQDKEYIRMLAREIAFCVFEEAGPLLCQRCKPSKDLAKLKWLMIGVGIGMPLGTAGIVVGFIKLVPAIAGVL